MYAPNIVGEGGGEENAGQTRDSEVEGGEPNNPSLGESAGPFFNGPDSSRGALHIEVTHKASGKRITGRGSVCLYSQDEKATASSSA